MIYLRYVLLAVMTLVVACAHSPVQIDVDPELTVEESQAGSDAALQFKVVDQRSTKAIGSRGGVYDESALITASNDVAAAMAEDLVEGFKKTGFTLSDEAPTTVTVVLRELSFTTPNKNYVSDVEVTAVVAVKASRENLNYESNYNTTTRHRFVTPPGEKKTAEVMNAVLSQSLSRLFADQKMMSFLSAR